MIHLICGPIGAGKTTIAHKISEDCGAIRFSEDEWLNILFIPDAPNTLLEQPMEEIALWASEKYLRCRRQIWHICQQLLTQEIPIVLDGAAANKEQRDEIRKKAIENNVGFQLHYVTSDKNTRKKRVFERNIEKGKTYSIEVTEDMFNKMEIFFEAPKDEELIGAEIIET